MTIEELREDLLKYNQKAKVEITKEFDSGSSGTGPMERDLEITRVIDLETRVILVTD